MQYLVREKETLSQAQMPDKKSRYANIRGVFAIKNVYQETHDTADNYLVDDVVISGSTVQEAGRALKQFGVEKIYVFSLAKG